MTVSAQIVSALTSLVSGRVYPNVARNAITVPYITYEQVGGVAPIYMDSTVPNKRNGRFQINVWCASAIAAETLALQVESALVTTLNATPESASVDLPADPSLVRYGKRQDFSIWFTPS